MKGVLELLHLLELACKFSKGPNQVARVFQDVVSIQALISPWHRYRTYILLSVCSFPFGAQG